MERRRFNALNVVTSTPVFYHKMLALFFPFSPWQTKRVEFCKSNIELEFKMKYYNQNIFLFNQRDDIKIKETNWRMKISKFFVWYSSNTVPYVGLNSKIYRTLLFVLDYSESHQERKVKERVNLLQDCTQAAGETHGASVVDFNPVMLHLSVNGKLIRNNFISSSQSLPPC